MRVLLVIAVSVPALGELSPRGFLTTQRIVLSPDPITRVLPKITFAGETQQYSWGSNMQGQTVWTIQRADADPQILLSADGNRRSISFVADIVTVEK